MELEVSTKDIKKHESKKWTVVEYIQQVKDNRFAATMQLQELVVSGGCTAKCLSAFMSPH